MKYYTPKGFHKPIPPDSFLIFPRWKMEKIRAIEIEFEFSEKCLYYFGDDADQKDWNKLAGLTFNAFNRDENAVMVGWRSNHDVGKIEVTAYSNIDGGRHIGWGEDQKMMYIEPGQKGKAVIKQSGLNWDFIFYLDGKVINTTRHILTKEFKKGYKVGNWFGGKDDDGNGLGGKAPHCFWIDYTFNVLKK